MTEQTANFSLPGYTELQQFARGGFSSVYRSTQLQYNRPVAIKVLDVGLDDERSRRQYQRECDATGRLTGHPNIVTVLDSGFTTSSKPYLVMDLCINGTMGDRLAREGPLPVADVLRTGVKIAGALETAHQAGILHRDLKPANILITAYGEPALSDFGIAAVTSQMEASVTMSAMTPNHAPPEVLEGHRPSAASDTYSLASTLYTLLAGRPPFAQESGHSILAFITRVLTAEVPPIPRHDIPAALSQTLVTALSKDPADRQGSAALFGYELQQIQVALGMPYSEMVTRTGVTTEAASVLTAAPAGTAGPIATAPDELAVGVAPAHPEPATAPPTTAPPTAAPGLGAVPPGESTVLRPGAAAAPTDTPPDGTGTGAAPAPTVAPPTPDHAPAPPTDGEMTMAVARHAPAIERIEIEAPPEKTSRAPLVVAVVVLLVVVLGGGAFLAFGRGGDDTASTTDTTVPTTAAPTSTSVADDPTSTAGPSPTDVAPTSSGPPTSVDTTTGGPAAGTAPAGVAARTRDAGGQVVIDVSWTNPTDTKLPVVYQLVGADGSALSKISTLGGGTSSVIVEDTDTGPLDGEQTYCVAVGFINSSAKAVWAPAACTDGTTLAAP